MKKYNTYPENLLYAVYKPDDCNCNAELIIKEFGKAYREETLLPEIKKDFDDTIKKLNEKYKNILYLRFEKGFTYNELVQHIPSETGNGKYIAKETARHRIKSAIRMIRFYAYYPKFNSIFSKLHKAIYETDDIQKETLLMCGLYQANVPNDGMIFVNTTNDQYENLENFLYNNCSKHYQIEKGADFPETMDCILVDNSLDYNKICDFLTKENIIIYNDKDSCLEEIKEFEKFDFDKK